MTSKQNKGPEKRAPNKSINKSSGKENEKQS